MSPYSDYLIEDRQKAVSFALEEDIREGDVTAHLIPDSTAASATVITREEIILCGIAWFEEVFRQLDPFSTIDIEWSAKDGDPVKANQTIVTLSGSAAILLTGERTALNFLQTLSATATVCHQYAKQVEGTSVKLLDTRKTIPGLRTAQKYAVHCGGCHNHRVGLYDAYLIKENHIAAAGSIQSAISQARANQPQLTVEVEVENLHQLEEALQAKADIIMLDNFSLDMIHVAVEKAKGLAKLEISGNVVFDQLHQYAKTGVDYISIGGLTKNIAAVDLSMRFDMNG